MDVLAGDRRIAATYEHPGLFVTVYLDATRSTESGAREVDGRWRDVRNGLEQAEADPAALAALEQAIGEDAGTAGPHGLVLVAADGELCFAERLHRPPATSVGSLAPLPHLLPYLAQRATDLPHVVVASSP